MTNLSEQQELAQFSSVKKWVGINLLAIIVAFAGGAYWVGGLENRVAVLEKASDRHASQRDDIQTLKKSVERLEAGQERIMQILLRGQPLPPGQR